MTREIGHSEGCTTDIKGQPARKRNHQSDPVEAERIEDSREGQWPTGLPAPERSREARRESRALDLAAGRVSLI